MAVAGTLLALAGCVSMTPMTFGSITPTKAVYVQSMDKVYEAHNEGRDIVIDTTLMLGQEKVPHVYYAALLKALEERGFAILDKPIDGALVLKPRVGIRKSLLPQIFQFTPLWGGAYPIIKLEVEVWQGEKRVALLKGANMFNLIYPATFFAKRMSTKVADDLVKVMEGGPGGTSAK